jgi:hypothetical protein
LIQNKEHKEKTMEIGNQRIMPHGYDKKIVSVHKFVKIICEWRILR